MNKIEKKISLFDKQKDQLRIKIKDTDDIKILGEVFDIATLKILYEFANKGIIKEMGGPVSTGKEANIFHAIGSERELAIKIYRISTSNFKEMQNYLIGDPRFSNIRHTKKDIVFAWTKKELRNLKRAYEAGVRVPKPIIAHKNVLVMEFIGKDGIPMPQLKDVELDKTQRKKIFNKIIEYIKLLYQNAKLVHSDLSEYNILYTNKNEYPIVFIDMGQSLTTDHYHAEEFLIRDIKNMVRFFNKQGIEYSEDKIIKEVRSK
ncbi:MAG: serine protein kinase RIO [Methanosarcinales archaeon]